MFGLSMRAVRFALIVSSAHFTQHVFYRVLPPLIPVLAVALEYPLWQLGLLITLYSFGMGVVQAPFGILADRIDRRYLLPTGLALAGAAYVLFALAPTLGAPLPTLVLFGHQFEGGYLVMALAMLVVGVGLAVVHPTGYPLITDNVSEANKGKVLGAFGASSKVGDGTAPAIIAGLILVLAWDRIILLFGLAGVVYGVGLYAALRGEEFETVPTGRRADETMGEGEQADDSGDRLDPEKPRVLEGDRRQFLYPMTAIYLFFVTSGLTSHGITAFLPVFLVAVYGYSVEMGGVTAGAESVANIYFAGVLLSGALLQLYLGGLVDRYDPRTIMLGCMAMATVGLVVLAFLPLGPYTLAAVVIVLGAGLYGINPARDALISDLSPPAFEGRAFGYIFTAVSLTGAAFPAIIGYLLETQGMRRGYGLLAIGTVLATGCILLLYSDRVYLEASATDTRSAPSD